MLEAKPDVELFNVKRDSVIIGAPFVFGDQVGSAAAMIPQGVDDRLKAGEAGCLPARFWLNELEAVRYLKLTAL